MSVSEIDDVDRLKKINQVLIDRMERVTDQQRNPFSLFQTAITLEDQVRRRTDELKKALDHLEETNDALELQRKIADQANQSKTRFLAAASHDVLQPLQAAQLSMSILRDMQSEDRGAALVDQVERSLETMDELLRTLLDLSKLDAGVVVPCEEPVSLAELAAHLEPDFQVVAEKKGLTLTFDVDPFHVKTDRAMLRRVLQNLIANAVRYTKTGTIQVMTKLIDDQVAIDVIDTGIGISKDDQARIFEEFFRANSGKSHSTDQTGLGLGLSIVKRLVMTLGITLTVHSVKGVGSRFRIVLDQTQDAPKPTPIVEKRLSPPQAFSTKKILIIENDKDVRETMDALLQSWGCETRLAATEKQALDQTDDGWLPDAMIVDQQLDDDDLGTDTIVTIRGVAQNTVPAILLTADVSAKTQEKADELGVDHVQKPIRPAELRALLNHLLPQNVG